MANYFKYSLVRLAPGDTRDERINIGVAIFTDESVDIRLAKRLEKVHAISGALEIDTLREIVENLRELDKRNVDLNKSLEDRAASLSNLGPLTLSAFGTFVAERSTDYEDRIASMMRALVDAEAPTPKIREKRSKLLTQVKLQFKRERVLARRDEDLSSHRIVSSYQLEQGLVADLVLQNGAMHVVETVDASGESETLRKAVSDIGVAALVFERSRMTFGNQNTKAQLVYSASPALENVARPSLEAAARQGAELTNWASADDRLKFVHTLASLASPIERKRRTKQVVSGQLRWY